nr:uncharacterized protein LOC107411071 [Ziziphus jujuba var. spinosa]
MSFTNVGFFYFFFLLTYNGYLCHFVNEAYDQICEVCIFLINNFSLPADKAFTIYIPSLESPFLFCNVVAVSHLSAILCNNPDHPHPKPRGQFQLNANVIPLLAKIEVSVEDLATLQSLDVVSSKKIERLAMKVGENLFNFIQSFCGVDWSKLVVLLDILDRWFKKFQEGAKCDPKCF